MLPPLNCAERGCKHYQGVKQPDGTELSEFEYCDAFPDGIPSDIAYGDNAHLAPVEGDHGIQFEAT